jgi:membrane protein
MTGTTAALSADPVSAGWKELPLRVYSGISEHRIFSLAAASTYYCLLAIFPALAALVGIYGLFADPNAIGQQLVSLQGLLPEGALSVIETELKRISSQSNGALSLSMAAGLLFALWSANSATKALFDSLGQIYREKEERGFVKLTLITLAFTVGTIALLILALASIVVLPIVLDQLGLLGATSLALKLARWPLLFVAIAIALALVYRFGPDRSMPQWKWITWGSATAASLWIIASLLFSWYAANFGSFNKTYGSLGAIIGFMIWMWISTSVVLLGAEIDAEMEQLHARRQAVDRNAFATASL